MKIRLKIILIKFAILFALIGCDSKTVNKGVNPNSSINDSGESPKNELVTSDFLGTYHGIQPKYDMKNEFGEVLLIRGKKVSIPSIDYNFQIGDNSSVRLQQTNLEDERRVYYDGEYKIISQETNTVVIECSVSDGKYSNPKYTLKINKIDKKGECSGGSDEPSFSLEKIK